MTTSMRDGADSMNPDDMARELRAAGWNECPCGAWQAPGEKYGRHYLAREAHDELAREREAGTVNPPVLCEGGKT